MRKHNTVFFIPFKDAENTNFDPDCADGSEDLSEDDSAIVLTETLDEGQKQEEKENLQSKEKKVIPVQDIESIYCFSEINFNTRFLKFLTTHKIPLQVFNYYGFYSGTYYPRTYLHSGFLLVNQVKHHIDNKKRLSLAKEFIKSAAFNILKNLRYYNSRGSDLKDLIEKLENYSKQISEAKNIPELMGIEGRIRQNYYQSWDTILTDPTDTFKFVKRSKRPPTDAINALISFGNTMVYTTVLSEIYHTQLNPTISYLHEPTARRFSLSLDIAEIFKPLFTDRIIFKLINQNQIKGKHFEKKLNFCYLNEKGREIFLREFEEKLKSTINHRKLERHVSYRRLIRLECYKLVKLFTKDAEYEAFKAWW